MSVKKFDAVATVGEYTDRNGQTKKRYLNVGAVFENENGLSLKLDAVPMSKDWSGWIAFYPPKPREQRPRRTTAACASRPGLRRASTTKFRSELTQNGLWSLTGGR